MITNVAFNVPGEPQGKGRAKIVKIGGFSRMATPEKTVAYEGLVAHVASQAMQGAKPFDGPCAVDVLATLPVPASWSKRKPKHWPGRFSPPRSPTPTTCSKPSLTA
jgi:Holliday junction resolvase RusA-like endonuclease